MPTSASPLAAYKIAEDLRLCVHDRLAETPLGTPSRSCVVAGAIAWDDCECGQLVVSISRAYFSSNFPVPTSATISNRGRCGPPLLVFEYLISILRCAPSGEDDAQSPSCADLDVAAKNIVHDAWAALWGAQCCLREWAKSHDVNIHIADFEIREQRFVGPEGLCQGSETPVLVGIMNSCLPCDFGS